MSVRLQDDAGKVMVSRGDQDTPEPPATADLLYHRPSFSGEERVFFDLVAYAPGMNTSQADIQAVLEAEAAPHLGSGPGRIDPAARKLIDRARQGGWQQLTLLASAGKPVTVFFDGSGRYAYDRVLPLGLHERVVCDGQTLLHLYPELGMGARRTVSRFHRADFTRLVPWLLPPAEDLAHGADLTCMDNRTVAITPRDADSARDADGKPVPYLQTRLLFAADGRLTERRLVEMPSGKVLARETYDADGMVRLLNARDEAVAEDRILLAPARVVPDVKPDTEDLVVLPLPWRTRDHVRQVLKIEQPYQNLDADAALALFAAEFAGQNGSEAVQIYGQRFYNRGKNLLGFYTFLAACGVNVDAEQQFLNILNEHPREPLAEYLAFHSNPDFRRHAHRGEISGPVDGFLQRLADFRVLYMYWQSGRIQSAGAAERRAEQDRALEYVRRNASSLLGWALLCAVQDHTQDDHQFQTAIAETWKLFENAPGLEYLARYERARCLLKAGQEVEARQVFRDLYDRTFQAGYLPPIDGDFRTALQASGQDNPEEWDPLLRRTAAVLVKDGQRPAVIDLAWQAWQLGDQPLADHLLADALDHLTEGPERLKTMVSAIAFLMRTQQYARADNLLQPLLNDKYFSQRAGLWRLGEQIAGQRGQKARARACLEKALEIEYRDLPEVINLQAVRSDYGALLDHYQEVVDAVSTLQLKPPADLGARVIRAADQWRSLDRDGTAACQAAAKILQRLYARDLAWEFLTTPVGLQPNESGPWLALAQSEHQEGDFDLADRAYTAAYEAEPTNAQILWDEAQNLQQAGQAEAAQQVYRRLAEGHWQPRFNTLQAQARWQLGVR
ncbi:MAG: hypothetical protein JO112_14365 [Planctomycetes bacterium]|nr:hypothetical protein [Planctomycetota bacterium]